MFVRVWLCQLHGKDQWVGMWPTLLAPLPATLIKVLVSDIVEKYVSSVPQNLLC